VGQRAEGRNRGGRERTASQTGQWLWQERVRAEENQGERSPRCAEQAGWGRFLATDAGAAKLREARPAWERAQERLRSRLPKEIWASLLDLLPELTRLADIA